MRVKVRFGELTLTGTVDYDRPDYVEVHLDSDSPVMPGQIAPFLRERVEQVDFEDSEEILCGWTEEACLESQRKYGSTCPAHLSVKAEVRQASGVPMIDEETVLQHKAGRWSVYRHGGLVDSRNGYAWPWAVATTELYGKPSWVEVGAMEIRLDGKVVCRF